MFAFFQINKDLTKIKKLHVLARPLKVAEAGGHGGVVAVSVAAMTSGGTSCLRLLGCRRHCGFKAGSCSFRLSGFLGGFQNCNRA